MRIFALLSCLVALTGCVGNLQRLNAANPSGDDFHSALAAEYQAYAQSEFEQGHLFNSMHFAGKGTDALDGKTVEPEPVDTTLPAEQQKELADSRELLIAMLDPEMKEEHPQKLARAQLLFDCWQHQLKKRMDQERADEIAPCADEFKATYADLLDGDDSGDVPAAAYSVRFTSGSATVGPNGAAILKKLATHLGKAPHSMLALEGFGSPAKLVHQRLVAVSNVLVKDGIPSDHIRFKTSATKAVLLSNDKPAAGDSRVDITIEPYGQPTTGRPNPKEHNP